jgi:hypothetical protein
LNAERTELKVKTAGMKLLQTTEGLIERDKTISKGEKVINSQAWHDKAKIVAWKSKEG